ncbi:MAG: DUF397 domain-containing protein [Candidatus Pacebacteria bacterium]|nr:DUF397 domain-containing protein [Candidatus Paceibacterota bacterium]
MANGARKPFTFPVTDGDFVKSSYSNPGGLISTCVEVAVKPEGVAVRDSKATNGPVLYFTHDEFVAFKKGVAAGEFGG